MSGVDLEIASRRILRELRTGARVLPALVDACGLTFDETKRVLAHLLECGAVRHSDGLWGLP